MTMTLELPEDVHKGLQVLAEEYEESLTEVVIDALRDYLEQAEHRRAVKAAGDYVQQKNAELYERLA